RRLGLDAELARPLADRVDPHRTAELERRHARLPPIRFSRLAASRPLASWSSRAETEASAASDGGGKALRLARVAKRGQPAAERRHHPPDMLADHMVANPDLAQGRVHVV